PDEKHPPLRIKDDAAHTCRERAADAPVEAENGPGNFPEKRAMMKHGSSLAWAQAACAPPSLDVVNHRRPNVELLPSIGVVRGINGHSLPFQTEEVFRAAKRRTGSFRHACCHGPGLARRNGRARAIQRRGTRPWDCDRAFNNRN